MDTSQRIFCNIAAAILLPAPMELKASTYARKHTHTHTEAQRSKQLNLLKNEWLGEDKEKSNRMRRKEGVSERRMAGK